MNPTHPYVLRKKKTLFQTAHVPLLMVLKPDTFLMCAKSQATHHREIFSFQLVALLTCKFINVAFKMHICAVRCSKVQFKSIYSTFKNQPLLAKVLHILQIVTIQKHDTIKR